MGTLPVLALIGLATVTACSSSTTAAEPFDLPAHRPSTVLAATSEDGSVEVSVEVPGWLEVGYQAYARLRVEGPGAVCVVYATGARLEQPIRPDLRATPVETELWLESDDERPTELEVAVVTSDDCDDEATPRTTTTVNGEYTAVPGVGEWPLRSVEVTGIRGDMDEVVDALADARQRWADHGGAPYAMRIERFCECAEHQVRFVAVDDAGATVLAEDAYGEDQDAWTIESLFDEIDEATRTAAAVRVLFDAATGVPATLEIDPDETTADEELELGIAWFAGGA